MTTDSLLNFYNNGSKYILRNITMLSSRINRQAPSAMTPAVGSWRKMVEGGGHQCIEVEVVALRPDDPILLSFLKVRAVSGEGVRCEIMDGAVCYYGRFFLQSFRDWNAAFEDRSIEINLLNSGPVEVTKI
jgi:hypothetical protein